MPRYLFQVGFDTFEMECQKCGSPVVDDYCANNTCPYSNWPQHVELDDLTEMTTQEIEEEYGVSKRGGFLG